MMGPISAEGREREREREREIAWPFHGAQAVINTSPAKVHLSCSR
jgi:hypothetical protein